MMRRGLFGPVILLTAQRVQFVYRRSVILAFLSMLLGASSVAHAQTETVEYYATDALGSVRVVFDANGNILGRMDYGPFGQQLFPNTGKQQNIYAGLFVDSETGVDQADARSYQPRTGRFGAIDPVFSGLFEPQRWNRYAYAMNNSIRYMDPSGLDAQCRERKSSSEDGPQVDCTWSETVRGGGAGSNPTPGPMYDSTPTMGFFDMAHDFREGGRRAGANLQRRLAEINPACANAGTVADNPCTKLGMVPLSPAEIGAAGELIVKSLAEIGPKTVFEVNGAVKIADGMLTAKVTEIKNVARLAYTKQLQDYVAFARDTERQFDLWVRNGAKLSGPLRAAIRREGINLQTFIWP